MTNHWIDYRNSDVIMNIGGNTVENHPISMKWIQAALDNGAKLISVDPRFTRTSAVSDLYAPIRPGTNVAFFSGLINYAIENNKYHEEYVKLFTNASSLINPDFGYSDGLFTGVQDAPDLGDGQKSYDRTSWDYQRDEEGNILKDETLQDSNCVWQLFKNHYARYDVQTVSEITGCPEDKFVEVAEMFCSTGEPGKAGNISYAMGLTQFTHGSQNVRSCAILQLLLGNVGIAGGGVNAQRGQSNVQGACDMGQLFHIVTGYMPMPSDGQDLAAYNAAAPDSGYWVNRPKFMASMLKAFWGDNATEENDFHFDYLPRLDKNRSSVAYYTYMAKGEIKGLFCFADNPVVGGANTIRKRRAQAELDWLVCADIYENETAAFWKAPDMNPEEVDTEVFLLPACMHFEKEGTITNSGRWIQWRHKAQDPPGEAKPDYWIVNQLFHAIRNLYEEEGGAFPGPIVDMYWDYGDDEVDIPKVCMEINGFYWDTGELATGFGDITGSDDGEVAAGSWIYTGFYADEADPACKNRTRETEGLGLNHDWSFAWPANRRIVYNRCSCDAEGNPWNPDKALFRWEDNEWVTIDVPDFNANVPPEETADKPFIMTPELQSRLFAGLTGTMVDGPFPEHYEPWESITANRMSDVQFNPVCKVWYPEDRGESADYPYIATTYRLTEHYQTGIMTRNNPWLVEAMPEMFCEISPSLAAEIGVENGDMVEIESKRGTIQCKVAVTPRVKPLMINGEEKEIVGMPWHWGFKGLSSGASANDLTPTIGCANTTIPEFKSFICNIRRAG